MKYGQGYLTSSYASSKKPSTASSIISYATKWTKEVVTAIGTWTRN